MTITEKTEAIKNILDYYQKAKTTNNKIIIERVVDEMKSVYIMVCCCSVPGSDTLRKAILEAEEI